MILIAMLGVVLLIVGGVRAAKRNPPRASNDDDDDDEESPAIEPAVRQRISPMMLVGMMLVVGGGFGAGIAAGPAPVKLLCAAAVAFVAFQVLRGIHRGNLP